MMGSMNPNQKTASLLALALLLLLALACKQPKGREWENAYPDETGTLDVDGPPRVRADEEWMNRRTAPPPVDPKKAKTEEEKKAEAEANKSTGNGAGSSPESGKKDGI